MFNSLPMFFKHLLLLSWITSFNTKLDFDFGCFEWDAFIQDCACFVIPQIWIAWSADLLFTYLVEQYCNGYNIGSITFSQSSLHIRLSCSVCHRLLKILLFYQGHSVSFLTSPWIICSQAQLSTNFGRSHTL